MISWIKIFLTNILVLSCLILIAEIGWSVYDRNLRIQEECESSWVLYNYCPKLITTNVNRVEDGGQSIKIEVDKFGGRVRPGSNSTYEEAKNFIIGDSFIQADEIFYADTIYGKWNNLLENSTYALGYSSWNPIQYLDAIKKINKSGSHYYVFLMTNDVNPNYWRSVYSQNRYNQKKYSKSILHDSLFFKTIKFIKRKLTDTFKKNYPNNKSFKIVSNSFSSQFIEDCSSLKTFEDSDYSKKIGFDYLVFSKVYECWPEIHKKAFKEFLNITKEIENYVVDDLSSKITFVWVSGGWAYKNQNSIGRLSSKYNFSPEISISQQGLVKEFKSYFPKTEVIDTEKLIKNSLLQCRENCKDKYYFAVDGHWTADTHKLIFDALRK